MFVFKLHGIPQACSPSAASRPVSPATRTLLMTGVSANGEGRRAYLAHRRSASPEGRYLYPQTSTQAMTWGVDAVLPREAPVRICACMVVKGWVSGGRAPG
jgi:hypothetical protein